MVSYSKGIESIVFQQLIFSECLFIDTDLDTECGRAIEITQFENMSIRRRIVVHPSPVSLFGRNSWLVSPCPCLYKTNYVSSSSTALVEDSLACPSELIIFFC